MEKITLPQTPLFSGIPPQEAQRLLACLGAQRRTFGKGERILRAGGQTGAMGLVLSGSVLIESVNFWGGAAVLDHVGAGQIFAETYACTPGEPLLVDVSAAEETALLFLGMERVLNPCARPCLCHSLLIRNLLALSAQKNLTLSRKILHTAPKTIRGRLLSYLSDQALRAGSRSFSIPFDRQQLADYLNVDRSSLSSEIGKLQREGVLRASRSRFELLGGGELPR